MLKKFKVKNFRSFRDEILFDLTSTRDYNFNQQLIRNGVVNKAIIYGPNGCGKSNLGFAIMDICAHLFDENKLEHYDTFLNLDSIETEATFTYLFQFGDKEIEYQYRKNVLKQLTFEQIKENGNLIFQYNYLTNQYINEIKEIETLDLTRKNNSNISMIKYIYNNSIQLTDESTIRQIVNFASNMLWFRSVRNFEYMNGLVKPENIGDYFINENKIVELENFFHECGINYHLMIGTEGTKKILCVQYKNGLAPLTSVASTGTMSLWLFFYWINKIKNVSFLFIDEFDAFYHFSLSMAILNKVLSKNNFQSVLTTHNTNLIGNNVMRPDCYFILSNNKIDNFANLTNKVIRQGHNLEKMMVSGEFNKNE